MASIVRRKKSVCVVYLYEDANGKKKQKWETFKTMDEAKRRRIEVEYQQQMGQLVISQCDILDDLLKEYVSLYGKTTWSISTYTSNMALIRNYISPFLGQMKLTDISPRVLERFYQRLQKTQAVATVTDKKGKEINRYVGAGTIKKIHNLLNSCFHQAVKWEVMEKNPAIYANVPKRESEKREIWDAETLFHALDVCEDPRLKLAINVAFSCSLRIGELLGLTWDCVDISEESIAEGRAYVSVTKELQRVKKDVLTTLEGKDVMFVFPEQKNNSHTVLVLKKPKTESSIRKVFLPKTVAEMLVAHRERQFADMEALGSEYTDYNLVLPNPFGHPMESSRINDMFHELIEKHDLPKVVFHSLRHSSITYKLKLNGGDVKSVQGDSGHAQAKMVTDQYSHILDDDRRKNARFFEEAFYSGNKVENTVPQKRASADDSSPAVSASSDDAAMLAKLLTNPETAGLLKALVAAMGNKDEGKEGPE